MTFWTRKNRCVSADRTHHGTQQGSSTIAVTGFVFGLLILASVILLGLSIAKDRQSLAFAADQAALAGAEVLTNVSLPEDERIMTACQTAQRYGRINGATNIRCYASATQVQISAQAPPSSKIIAELLQNLLPQPYLTVRAQAGLTSNHTDQ